MQTPSVSKPPKLLDQLRHQIRRLNYSIRTEDAYVYWTAAGTPEVVAIRARSHYTAVLPQRKTSVTAADYS